MRRLASYPEGMTEKIFGIGLNKTGTTSLKLAFQKLGYRHLDRKPRLFKLWKKREFDKIFEWIEAYETFEDWPWPLMVPELLRQYPEARFVLTRRETPQAWVESLKSHAMRTNPRNNPREVIFGYRYPHGYEREHIGFYQRHLDQTRAVFAGRRDQLLELCFEQGDGWTELCSFLEKKPPRMDFPHGNRARDAAPNPENYAENQRLVELQLKKAKNN